MNFKPSPSLRGRLLLTLLLPLSALLLMAGYVGGWFAGKIVESISDRVLSGSLQAISETLAIQNGQLTLNLPPSALGMLENPDRDNIYYSIWYRGKCVTGYPELAMPNALPNPDEIDFRYSAFHNNPIRIATETKLVPQLSSPVLVQVAETVTDRRDLTKSVLAALALCELLLLAIVALLVMAAIDWGLKPLSVLQEELKRRSVEPEIDFTPLPVALAPTETSSFISSFNVLLEHVETILDTLRRFTSDASHQLRAPLAVIRTHVELLQRNTKGYHELKGPIDDIHSAVKSLQHLITQLLSLAKAERPTDIPDGEDLFDLVECAASVARSHALHALNSNVELSFESDNDESWVKGSATFAAEMISNVIDNALRYGDSGSSVTIRTSGETFEIEDRGPGIPAQDRERVFERFYRGPKTLDREGSGLGLSIVQALGRRMGATIELSDVENGKGLKVTMIFRPAHPKRNQELLGIGG